MWSGINRCRSYGVVRLYHACDVRFISKTIITFFTLMRRHRKSIYGFIADTILNGNFTPESQQEYVTRETRSFITDMKYGYAIQILSAISGNCAVYSSDECTLCLQKVVTL